MTFYPSPGYCGERMTIFTAEGLTAGPARPESDESIESRWFTVGEIDRMIRGGRIRGGKTLVGVLLARAGAGRRRGRPAKKM